jgi:hypothetical protein
MASIEGTLVNVLFMGSGDEIKLGAKMDGVDMFLPKATYFRVALESMLE